MKFDRNWGMKSSLIAMVTALTLSGCGGGGSSGGPSDPGPQAPPSPPPPVSPPAPPPSSVFQVDNPYALANASSVEDVRVDRLFVFGDSLARVTRGGIKYWPAELQTMGRVNDVSGFAESGARALKAARRTLENQIDAFVAEGKRANGGDLTIAYLGHNDIIKPDIPRAFSDYADGLDRLVDLGATSKNQRMFVTMLHNYARNPGAAGDESLKDTTIDWNKRVANYANAHDNVVAVDMFTPFERIFENPQDFGFENVTTVDTFNSTSTSLFFDNLHFGRRGQRIQARIYEYYLTRGWDSSNTLAAGAQATARLNADLDKGQVFSFSDDSQPLRFFALGETGEQNGIEEETESSTRYRSAFAQSPTSGGIGAEYSLTSGFDMGVALSHHGISNDADRTFSAAQSQAEQTAVSIYGNVKLDDMGAFGSWRSRTQISYSDNDYRTTIRDRVVGSIHQGRSQGQSFILRETLSGAIRGPGVWYAPFADLTYSEVEMNGFSIANDYFGTTTYGNTSAGELWSSFGLAAHLDPFELGHLGELSLNGRLAYRESLHRDDHVVNVSEGGLFGQQGREVIEQPDMRGVTLGLSGHLALGEALELSAGYNFDVQQGRDEEHLTTIGINWAF